MADQIIEPSNLENPIISWIYNRLTEQNRNVLAVFHGNRGNGKSSNAVKLAEMYDPNFSVDRIAFTPSEFMHLVNTVRKGSVIIWDEAGVGMSNRDWYSISNKIINSIVQTFRTQNLLVIFTVPALNFLDSALLKMFDIQAHCLAINFRTSRAKTRIFITQYNSRNNKTYTHSFKKNVNGKLINLNPIYWKKPSEKLWKKYDKRRNKFTEDLNRQSDSKIKQMEIKNSKKDNVLTDNEILKIVATNETKYRNRVKNISVALIMADFEVGMPRAKKIKALFERNQKN